MEHDDEKRADDSGAQPQEPSAVARETNEPPFATPVAAPATQGQGSQQSQPTSALKSHSSFGPSLPDRSKLNKPSGLGRDPRNPSFPSNSTGRTQVLGIRPLPQVLIFPPSFFSTTKILITSNFTTVYIPTFSQFSKAQQQYTTTCYQRAQVVAPVCRSSATQARALGQAHRQGCTRGKEQRQGGQLSHLWQQPHSSSCHLGDQALARRARHLMAQRRGVPS